MRPEEHAEAAQEHLAEASRRTRAASDVEPVVDALLGLAHAVLSLRPAPAEPVKVAKPEAERVAYRDAEGDIWVGTDDALQMGGPSSNALSLEVVAEDYGPLTQVPIPEHLR